MEYPGEHLLIGQIGNTFTIMAFAFSFMSAVAYFLAHKTKDEVYLRLGRLGFIVHSISVIGMVATLFTMIFNQYFEYHYVWQHSNTDMPMKYIFSCFWEGIEGSFLIWTFWHVILGALFLRKSGVWEAPAMSVVGAVQFFMLSMLLGVYIFDYKLGSNPFTMLLREHPDFAGLPLFNNPDYTKVIDGRGLNPLLQNYWMVIHPPFVLFGYATAIIPFAYAIAGLLRNEFIAWVKPALSWTFFGIAILGIGVLMGGAWAYESLSFGGFWAWDPVENASLVPWLTMVGAGHLMLIQRKKGVSVITLFLMTTITFCLVQYASFLTKSGVLGETSVHSFTDLGMTAQLAISLLFFTGLSAFLILTKMSKFPKQEREESITSREFWMFIASLVLLVSAFVISFSTSFPVINQIFGTELAIGTDRIDYYNRWQTPFAIITALLVSIGQFLKYSKTNMSKFWKNISLSSSIALLITVATAIGMSITNPLYLLMLFTTALAAAANLDFWVRIAKGNAKNAGASIAHIGFGLLLLGVLISTSQSEVISSNSSLYDVSMLGEDFNNNENILLMKDDTLIMGDYFVSYKGKREEEDRFIHYEVEYMLPDDQGNLQSEFTLYPFIQLNPRMGNVAEPYTKHYLHKDVYTHITYAELETPNETTEAVEHSVGLTDTIFTKTSFMVLDSLDRNPKARFGGLTDRDLAVGAMFTLYDVNTKAHQLEPLFVLRDRQYSFTVPDSIPELGIKITFDGIDPEAEEFKFRLTEEPPEFKDFIVMKAIIFPGINILWIGIIIMGLGTIFAVIQRIRRS
ncbi:MAG: cytochrome c biogenesis protein CcsA [Salibacteraceae bacterium]